MKVHWIEEAQAEEARKGSTAWLMCGRRLNGRRTASRALPSNTTRDTAQVTCAACRKVIGLPKA